MTADRVDVVVVGAGVAGLSASADLVTAGLRVQCLEARGRVGGRLLSVAAEGGRLDLGASWFWAGEHRVAALVERLGLRAHAQHLTGDAVYDDPQGAQPMQGNPVDVPAFRFSDGAQSLAEALAAELPDGTVRLNSPVVGVRAARDSKAIRVELNGRALLADHVVLAVPPALAVGAIDLPDLEPDVRALAARTPVWMGNMIKVVAQYAAPFWREAGLAGSGVSHVGPLRELHDLSGPDGSLAALFGFAPSDARSPVVQADDVVAQLVRMFGPRAAAPLQVLVQDWRTQAWTSPAAVEQLGAYDLFGHPLLARPAMAGRLHWATTETSAQSPGHVEGALAAAERAVAAVLASA
jgi:monoamine oxidase